jgi:hypothetical protein
MLQRHDRGMDTVCRVQYLPGEVRTKNTPHCFKEKKRKESQIVVFFKSFAKFIFTAKRSELLSERKNTN